MMKFDYDFKAVSMSDFKCVMEVGFANKIFNQVFVKSKNKLAGEKGITVEGELDEIDKFDVPSSHLKLLKTAIIKPFKRVVKIVGSDGIVVSDWDVSKAFYFRKGQDWVCCIEIGGMYVKK